MEKLNCKECQQEFTDYITLRKHRSMKHKISSEQTYIDYKLNGEIPECKCGCAERTKFLGDNVGFREYKWGHAAKIHNNWGNNPNFKEMKQKSAETQHKLHQEGKLNVWNKGLTIADARVKNNINKMLLSPTRSKQISEKLKGVPKSEESKRKNRESQIISWANPDKREKQSIKRIHFLTERNYKYGKTKLENLFENILIELGLRYVYQYRIETGLFDFYLPDLNIIIEVDGDFHHCNPLKYKEPKFPIQLNTVINDKRKNMICERNHFTLLRFWETDIKQNPDKVILKLKEYLP